MGNKPNRLGESLINEFCTYLTVGTKMSYDEKTVKQYKDDIWDYWEKTGFENLKDFNADKAKLYRRSIQGSMQTKHQKMNRVAEFFRWIFGKKVTKPDISEALKVLQLTNAEKGLLSKHKIRKYPTLDEFNEIIDFPVNNDIDRRDKALLCFLLLSAGRVDAVRTLPLGALNPKTLDLVQDPTEGVHTKRNKYIIGTLFRFDEVYTDIIRDWLQFLTEIKHFKATDPLFPKLVPSEENSALYVLSNEFYSSKSKINEIVASRCIDKDIPAYSAHEFRHLAVDTAFRLARNGREIKAISQNVGHAYLTITLRQYANMQPQEYMEIIKGLTFRVDEQARVCDLTNEDLIEIIHLRTQRSWRKGF